MIGVIKPYDDGSLEIGFEKDSGKTTELKVVYGGEVLDLTISGRIKFYELEVWGIIVIEKDILTYL